MSKSEKRSFKLYAGRLSNKEGTMKFVQLFDLIDAQQEADDEALLQQIAEGQPGKLANLKRHLYQQLLVSLRIDSEPVVRSNCIWALGRLMDQLVQPRQAEIVEALVSALLHDSELSVRDEARTALEQLEDPLVLERLQALINDGFIL